MSGSGTIKRAVKRGARAEVASITIDAGYGDINPSFFVNNTGFALRIRNITCRLDVDNGGALTATVKKAPSGTAITSGTAIHSTAWDMDAAGNLNTNFVPGLSTTPGDVILAPGDALGVDLSALVGSAYGSVNVDLVPA